MQTLNADIIFVNGYECGAPIFWAVPISALYRGIGSVLSDVLQDKIPAGNESVASPVGG